jgi:hypothetical protein
LKKSRAVRLTRIWRVISAAVLGSLFVASAAGAEAHPSDENESFLSRITIEVPVFTRHVPHDNGFNDHNWGAFIDIALNRKWSVVMGDYINSYRRSTIFAGLSYMPIGLEFSKVRVSVGAMAAVDINGGYRHFNQVEPLLGALSIKVTGAHFEDPKFDVLNRLGIAVTIIPPKANGGSAPVNFALTYRLQSSARQ